MPHITDDNISRQTKQNTQKDNVSTLRQTQKSNLDWLIENKL